MEAGDKNPGVCTPSSPTPAQLLPLLSPVLRGLLLEQGCERQEDRLTNGDAQSEAEIMGSASSLVPGMGEGLSPTPSSGENSLGEADKL